MRTRRLRWFSRGLGVVMLGLTAPSLVFEPFSQGASAGEPDPVRVLGTMPSEIFTGEGLPALPMIVDATHNLGFNVGPSVHAPEQTRMVMYDLERLETLKQAPANFTVPIPDIRSWAIDESAQRIYTTQMIPNPGDVNVIGIDHGACLDDLPPRLWVIDYGPGPGGQRDLVAKKIDFPCGGLEKFVSTAASYWESPDKSVKKLYFSGYYARDGGRDNAIGGDAGAGVYQNMAASLIVREVEIVGDRLAVRWDVDLGLGGCGRRGVMFAQRSGSEVVSYCYDTRPSAFAIVAGNQGFVAKIHLVNGRPETRGPEFKDPAHPLLVNARVRRTPALPGQVTPIVDAASGRLFLATADTVNGNAVWAHDLASERFVGIVTGGYSRQPKGNAAIGFDRERGRGYVLTQGGLLVASLRHTPVPPGLIYPGTDRKLANPTGKTDFVAPLPPAFSLIGSGGVPTIAVAPKLHRLFIPLSETGACPPGVPRCPRYVVVEDGTADLQEPAVSSVSRTSQVAEAEGKTFATASGAATATGAHVVVVGGVPSAAQNNDPLCNAPHSSLTPAEIERALLAGRCVPEVLVATGHREAFFAASQGDAGSDTGTSALASGMAFGSADSATAADLEDLGRCEERRLRQFVGFLGEEFFEGLSKACAGVVGGTTEAGAPDLSRGTAGSDGRGFLVRRSECGDYGGGLKRDARPDGPTAPVEGSMSASAVECDGSTAAIDARAASTTQSVGDPGTFAMLSVSSHVSSQTTDQGRVTTATAAATGVRIGPIHIDEVRSTAVTRARGRSGSAVVEYSRLWCGVSVDGHEQEEGCFDPSSREGTQIIDEMNQLLGRVRISLPPVFTEATDDGYQSVVTKDLGARSVDRAVNNDDSPMVAALEVTIYNDGPERLSRLVVQLAGVHAEARYGVTELPNFAVPDFATSAADQSATSPRTRHTTTAGRPVRSAEMINRPGTAVLAVPVSRQAPFGDVEPTSLFERALRVLPQLLQEGLNLLVSEPAQFVALFVLWAFLFGAPYLMLRRRGLAIRLEMGE